jgi:hypothetical protein
VPTAWRKVSAEHRSSNNGSVNPEQLYSRQTISVSNGYSVSSHLPDSMDTEVETASLSSKKPTQFHSNYQNRCNELRAVKNPSSNNRLVHQPRSPSVQVSINDLVNDYKNVPHINCIPALVNGQVCSDKDRNMKNVVFWDLTPATHVRTDVSEEFSTSIIRVTRIGELGTTLAVSTSVASYG